MAVLVAANHRIARVVIGKLNSPVVKKRNAEVVVRAGMPDFDAVMRAERLKYAFRILVQGLEVLLALVQTGHGDASSWVGMLQKDFEWMSVHAGFVSLRDGSRRFDNVTDAITAHSKEAWKRKVKRAIESSCS